LIIKRFSLLCFQVFGRDSWSRAAVSETAVRDLGF
jgi:hypothetical protein